MNTMKTFFLMALLTVLLIVVGNLVGGNNGMFFAFIFALIINLGTYWFSDKIVLRMYNAHQIERKDHPRLFQILEELTTQAGLPMPKVYIIPKEQPNAFATGRNPNHSAVALTEGLLRLLSTDELRGVISHELAHIKHRDILVGTVAATIAGAISMLANMAHWALIFSGGRGSDRNGGHPIAMLATIIIAPIVAMMIQMAISRSREFLADAGGSKMTGNPLSLANALRKLHMKSQQIPMNANPATAHMFTVNPLSGRGFAKLFSTHPPIEERIEKLEAMVYSTPR